MNGSSRLSAVIAYIPVIGWLYVFIFQRKNLLAIYHLRQSIGLLLFLIGVLLSWAVISWILVWNPFLEILGIGWLYLYVTQRKNFLERYHSKPSIWLIVGLIAALLGWAVVSWVIGQVPILDVLAVAAFSIVIGAYMLGAVAWVLGLINASSNKLAPLPLFGQWASRLPIK